MGLKEYIKGKLIDDILNDPVYKNYYCLKIVDKRGDIIITPVIDHAFLHAAVLPGLNLGIAARTISSYEFLACQVSEDEASDLMYAELDYLGIKV